MQVKVWCEKCSGDGALTKNVWGQILEECPDCKGEGYTGQEFVRLAKDQNLPDIPSFAYDPPEHRHLLQQGAIVYSKLLHGWMKVEK